MSILKTTKYNMFTRMSASALLVVFAVVVTAGQRCPDLISFSCEDEGIPCPSSKHIPKKTYFKLDDGNECQACQICVASVTPCPALPCWTRAFPSHCKTVNTYPTYIKTLSGSCPTCDVSSCLN